MTVEQLSAVAGIVLSLSFSYIPGLSDRYDALDAKAKSLVMFVMLLAVSIGSFGLSCGNIVAVVECSKDGVLGLVSTFVSALIANQSSYLITRKIGTSK